MGKHHARRLKRDPEAMTIGAVLHILGLGAIDRRPGRGAHRPEFEIIDPEAPTEWIDMSLAPNGTIPLGVFA